jgi:Mn2+/Fe2+ NRAMP family transporter
MLFAVGLLNAALLSAAILPLATAYNVAEGLGFESGIDKGFSEAPAFYRGTVRQLVLRSRRADSRSTHVCRPDTAN